MQGPSSDRVRVVLLFLAGVALIVLFGLSSGVGHSAAQTGAGYGNAAPQDQVIQPTSSGGSSHTGFFIGTGAALVLIGGGAFYGLYHTGFTLFGHHYGGPDSF